MITSKILSQKKNPFLEREEIIIEINDKITPSKEEVKKIFDKEKDLIVVRNINANFGRNSFIASVFVYDSKEAKEKIETIPKKIKKTEEKKKSEENSRGNEPSQ